MSYPVAIIQDRYSGAYSGGLWLAVAGADALTGHGQMRALYVLTDGPHGDDCDAMMFWQEPPEWIAVGATPDDALQALRAKEEGGS